MKPGGFGMKSANSEESTVGRHLWRLLPYVRPYRRDVWIGVGANVLARVFDLLPLVIVGRVVDLLAKGERDHTVYMLWGFFVLLTFLGLAAFQSYSDYLWSRIAERVRHDLRVKLYRHLQKLEAAFFEEKQTGELISIVSNDIDNLENFLSDATTSVIRIVITFVGAYGILLWLDWRLALLLFIPLPIVVVVIRFFANSIQPRYRLARKAVGDINSVIENNFQGIGVIQAYTAEEEQARRVEERSAEYRDASVGAAFERAKFIPLIYAIAGVSYGALIGGGAWLSLSGHGPSIGDYTSFILFAMRLVMPLFIFGMLINQIQRSESSAQRIMGLLDLDPKIFDAPDAKTLEEPPGELVFDRVGFSYPGREAVLHGVNVTVGRGKVVGIVGPTGAGKSTLIKLLLRYYDVTKGQIRVNGVALTDLKLSGLREHIGYVSQDAFLFSGTIEENIKLGSPDATDEEVARAARIAGAEEFIRETPQGFKTLVGERGVKLSGGQRQRINLARALLRDPAILVLDEATSAVDTRTEEIIQRNLQNFREGRITLAVAHRLSTVRHCDEILVLVDGVVVERGSHDALLVAHGVYADLWAVQSGESEQKSNGLGGDA